MRQAYLVTYDICDPRRLRQVFQTMRGYGDHLQLSVFRCELTLRERIELRAKLRDILHLGEDHVLFVDLGPADGRALTSIESLGRAYTHPERLAVVV
jgi:CRISPR-associated protein Cas2